jgi:hypothetical protein
MPFSLVALLPHLELRGAVTWGRFAPGGPPESPPSAFDCKD